MTWEKRLSWHYWHLSNMWKTHKNNNWHQIILHYCQCFPHCLSQSPTACHCLQMHVIFSHCLVSLATGCLLGVCLFSIYVHVINCCNIVLSSIVHVPFCPCASECTNSRALSTAFLNLNSALSIQELSFQKWFLSYILLQTKKIPLQLQHTKLYNYSTQNFRNRLAGTRCLGPMEWAVRMICSARARTWLK